MHLNSDSNVKDNRLEYKIYYIKTFVIHVVLESVFIFLNLLLGSLLLLENTTGSPKFWYAVLILVLPWIPSIFLVNRKILNQILPEKNAIFKLIGITIFFILFPIISILIHLLVLLGKVKNPAIVKNLLKLTHIKVLLHTSIFCIVIVFVTIRGMLKFDNTCIVDDLGRSACIIYPAGITFILSFILNIKSSCDYSGTDNLIKYTTNLIFRITSYAVTVSYLDYWSNIPILLMFLVTIALSYNSKGKSDNDEDDIDAKYGLMWVANEWVLVQPEQENCQNNMSTFNNIKYSDNFIVKIILQMILPQDKSIAIILNFILVLVLLIIMYLINCDIMFNYEFSILNNKVFNYLMISMLIAGLLSNILNWFCNKIKVQKFCQIMFSFLIFMYFPILLCLPAFKNSTSTIYLFLQTAKILF